MDYLKKNYAYDTELLESILYLIVETVCTNRKQLRIASDDKSAEVVKSCLMKLNSEHIKFIIKCFKESTTKIHNIRRYLLAMIYNATLTIDGYYDALVRHDMEHGVFNDGR